MLQLFNIWSHKKISAEVKLNVIRVRKFQKENVLLSQYHCKSCFHLSTEREKCPELERQKQIRFYMSRNAISFYEASQLVVPIRKNCNLQDKIFPRLEEKEKVKGNRSEGVGKSYLSYAIENSHMPPYRKVTSYKRHLHPLNRVIVENQQEIVYFNLKRERNLLLYPQSEKNGFQSEVQGSATNIENNGGSSKSVMQVEITEKMRRISQPQQNLVKKYIDGLINGPLFVPGLSTQDRSQERGKLPMQQLRKL